MVGKWVRCLQSERVGLPAVAAAVAACSQPTNLHIITDGRQGIDVGGSCSARSHVSYQNLEELQYLSMTRTEHFEGQLVI